MTLRLDKESMSDLEKVLDNLKKKTSLINNSIFFEYENKNNKKVVITVYPRQISEN